MKERQRNRALASQPDTEAPGELARGLAWELRPGGSRLVCTQGGHTPCPQQGISFKGEIVASSQMTESKSPLLGLTESRGGPQSHPGTLEKSQS